METALIHAETSLMPRYYSCLQTLHWTGNLFGICTWSDRIGQEAQLMLTTGSTRLAVSRGQQTWYHFRSIATFR